MKKTGFYGAWSVGWASGKLQLNMSEISAGQETKYPLNKMLKLAADGILSFSYKPLELATYIGFLLSVSGFIYLIYVLYQKLFTDKTQRGFYYCCQSRFNGITLLILGILGEYVGRIYEEVRRPLYIVKEVVGFHDDEE